MSDSENIEDVVGQFIAHKRALGRKYNSAETELRLLVLRDHRSELSTADVGRRPPGRVR